MKKPFDKSKSTLTVKSYFLRRNYLNFEGIDYLYHQDHNLWIIMIVSAEQLLTLTYEPFSVTFIRSWSDLKSN